MVSQLMRHVMETTRSADGQHYVYPLKERMRYWMYIVGWVAIMGFFFGLWWLPWQ